MFVWGSGAVAYIYANRRCSSKIIITDYVSGRQFGVSNDAMGKNENHYINYLREEFMKEFEKHLPIVFIDTSPSGYYGYDKFPLKNFTQLDILIKERYTLVDSIDTMYMYLLKGHKKLQ